MIKKEEIKTLTYELECTSNALPVFEISFYGIYKVKENADSFINSKEFNAMDKIHSWRGIRDGNEIKIPLKELERNGIGSLSGDGALGIVLGAGRKTISFKFTKKVDSNSPEEQFRNKLKSQLSKIEIEYYKDITEGSNYLKLDLDTMEMNAYKKLDITYTKESDALFFRRIEPGYFSGASDVSLDGAYYISISPITQIQWTKITDEKISNNSDLEADTEKANTTSIRSSVKVSYDDICGKNENEKYLSPSKNSESWVNHPFIAYLTSKTGGREKEIGLFFDLPTEAQWEYALFEKNDDLFERENILEWCYDWYQKNISCDYWAYNPYGPYEGEEGKRVVRNAAKREFRSGSKANSSDPENRFAFRLVLQEKDFTKLEIKYTTPNSKRSLPIFSTEFYGISKDGSKVLLDGLLGELTKAGSMGITFGSGNHKAIWETRKRYENLKIKVDCKDVTKEATYLVLDIENKKMRAANEISNQINKDDASRTNEIWFRRIEPGTFMMGTSEKDFLRYEKICRENIEKGKNRDINRAIFENLKVCSRLEKQHEVVITEAFYIAVFPTTQAQWKKINEDGYNPSKYIDDMRPVEQISFNWKKNSELKSFLEILKKFDGEDLIFDIPTEAEWEYACRAGYDTDLNNGKNLADLVQDDNLDKLGQYWQNGGGASDDFKLSASNLGKAQPGNQKAIAGAHKGLLKFHRVNNASAKVGSYLPNDWGLYDMHGNVFEWCKDQFQGDDLKINPDGPKDIIYGVLRGGSWNTHAAFYCRSAHRIFHKQGDDPVSCGFRLILVGKNRTTKKEKN